MDLDVLMLSRVQFALTVMFHYIFPPLSIGLGMLMVFMEGMYLKTGDRQYHNMTRFWSRVFAVNFAMGVATGIVMEFQFGTNWASYSRYVGDIFGSALAAEGIFAFFLESGFLAVLVFGWDRVSPPMHFFATCMVALGSLFSAVWIIVANSWMQTPAGFKLVTKDGLVRAEVTDFWEMVCNPSTGPRLLHTVIGAYILGAFFVMSISAFYLLRRRHEEFARRSFTLALIFGAISSIGAAVTGDMSARLVAEHQPAKLAAMEGHFESGTGPTPLYIFGIPDEEEQRVKFGLYIPYGLTFLVHHDFSTPVEGLDKTPPENRPPVMLPFLCFHLMVGLGSFFIALTLYALYLRWRGTLFEKRWLMWVFVVTVVGAYLVNQAGWVTAEVGRQPWVVYGQLRTSDAVSKSLSGDQVLSSIILFGLIYVMLFAVWVYVLNSKIQHGPDAVEEPPPETTPGGLLEAAGSLAARGGRSLTTAGETPPAQPSATSERKN
jgi:cytochrome d ubiquinol oxidase subunit I